MPQSSPRSVAQHLAGYKQPKQIHFIAFEEFSTERVPEEVATPRARSEVASITSKPTTSIATSDATSITVRDRNLVDDLIGKRLVQTETMWLVVRDHAHRRADRDRGMHAW
ncbi:MAG: hypothetical protein V9G22_15865 [Ottowia sp.]